MSVAGLCATGEPLITTELPDYPRPMDITKATHIQLLITGSLYLVGGVMSAIGYKADNE